MSTTTTTTPPKKLLTIVQRVANGEAFLDEVAPGWYTRIDLDTFKLLDGSRCICGQLFFQRKGKWRTMVMKKLRLTPTAREDIDNQMTGWEFAESLFGEGQAWILAHFKNLNGDTPNVEEIARRLGFTSTDSGEVYGYQHARGYTASWAGLESEWRRVIRRRLREDATAQILA